MFLTGPDLRSTTPKTLPHHPREKQRRGSAPSARSACHGPPEALPSPRPRCGIRGASQCLQNRSSRASTYRSYMGSAPGYSASSSARCSRRASMLSGSRSTSGLASRTARWRSNVRKRPRRHTRLRADQHRRDHALAVECMTEPLQGGFIERRHARFLVNDDHRLHRRPSTGSSPARYHDNLSVHCDSGSRTRLPPS
jgi:hypothetical protein